MIGSVVFALRANQSGKLPEAQGRLLHAAFFQILKTHSVELAACIHENVRFKPFTVSELLPTKENRRERYLHNISEGTRFYWRVTALEDRVLQAILSVSVGYVLKVGSVSMAVENIMRNQAENKNAGILDVDQLIMACLSVKSVKQITFRFSSPVSFRSFQDDYPFPLPQLIFGSIADKWNLAGMPVSFEQDEVRAAASQLLPVYWQGKTKQVYLKKDRGITGFTGNFTFKTDMLPTEQQQLLLLLAQFSQFSGVGRLTGQGLGQTMVTFQ